MESYYCYDLSEPGYARALLGRPAALGPAACRAALQNIISHGIARIAEFLTTDAPQVIAHGFVSPLLKSIGETDIVDELRVIITRRTRTTAYFTFSSQMRPSLHQFRLYGPRNGLVLDQDHETLIRLRGQAGSRATRRSSSRRACSPGSTLANVLDQRAGRSCAATST